MIVCPVCDHSQPSAGECGQCGKWLGPAPSTAVAAVAPLADLEQTVLPGTGAQVPLERMADLAATRLPSGPDLPTEAIPELERTHLAKVGAVRPEAMVDFERGRTVDPTPRTVAPSGAATCRYCKTVQADGAMCERCGMRLPRVAKAAGPAVAKAGAAGSTRCRSCGAPAKVGQRCGDCGRDVKAPEV